MKLFYEVGYRYFKMPWESGPREELVDLVESRRISPCRAIDLGCGTGDNAIFLAQHGFDVTGVDFAASAIEKAQTKAKAAGVSVHFMVDDLTILRHVSGTFEFLVDYGALDDLSLKDRKKYMQNVIPLALPGSQFLLWCFEWKMRRWENILLRLLPFGPISLEPGEVHRYFEKHFDVERLTGAAGLKGWPRGYACYLMTRKEVNDDP